MPVPTNVKFKDFLKAIVIIAVRKGWECKIIRGRGSRFRFELFNDNNEPFEMWTAHEDRKVKKVYSKDLKKACDNLKVTEEYFKKLISNKFK